MPVRVGAKSVNSQDYYGQIVASLTSGVVAVDHEGAIITANPAACAHLHLSPEVLRPGARFFELDELRQFRGILQEMQVTQQPVSRRELTVSTPEGAKVIGMTASLLQGPHAFNGVIFLFIDLTEIRQLRHAAELNRQLAQIGELTAGVVHELRNPLSVISGMAELLMRKLGEGNEHQQKAKVIFEEAAQLEKLISQFLSFARPFDVKPVRCAVEEIVDRAVQLCERLTEERRATLRVHYVAPPPPLEADASKLALALSNILRNAIEIVEPGRGEITLLVVPRDGGLGFRIEDNGPGIQLTEGEELFTAFLSKKEGGTGLGLAIVHRVVTAHGGTVTYGNRDGGGAWFEVRMPAAASGKG
ncbi:MAG: PAS domain-containing protein [Candidatus Hydrogenedentes bacterium]|nr:PAS domain-containing protein [Candidatus Hydrogenedentota bacterium]